jgi:hypothetical protein
MISSLPLGRFAMGCQQEAANQRERCGGAYREKLWRELGQKTILAKVLDLLDMLSRSFMVFRVGEVIGKGLWKQ